MTLNPQQLQAVKHGLGPLLIVAGAGTGKTTVITERIKFLILKKQIDPSRIFTATFTQKSAAELLSRLDEVMPLSYEEPWVGTFHGLADKLLKLEGLEIGLNPTFKIMTATDQWLFIKQHLTELNLKYYRPLGNPNKFISALITFFSRLQDEDVKPVEFNAFLSLKRLSDQSINDDGDIERLTELAGAYQAYDQLKRQESVMDFGDLILYTLKLFRERPNIIKKYRNHFQHLLIDEFQDTNYAQLELIKLLAPPENNPNLIVVGDDNQSIYKFRGASISNILEFKDLYPQARAIILTQNYRSTQDILDTAYRVIKHNDPETLEVKLGISKKLIALNRSGIVQNLSFPNLESEVQFTIEEIIRLVTAANLTYKDIAILTRSNSQLDPYVTALKTYGLPYQLVSNRGLYDQEEIRNLIYFLRVIIDPTDTLSLIPVTQMPLFSIAPAKLFAQLTQAKRQSVSLWSLLETDNDVSVSKMVTTIVDFQNKAASASVTRLLYQFVLDTGYVEQYIQEESLVNQLKIKNLNLFFNRLKQFEAVNSSRSVINFLSVLDQWLEAGEDPGQAQIEDVDTISLMTVHAAKGLEFPVVFIGSLVSGRFPSNTRKDAIQVPDALVKETIPEGNIHLQEERRLFYVALTRAKTHLYLTWSSDLGGSKKWLMSGFLAETGLSPQSPPSNGLQGLSASLLNPPMMQLIKGGKFKIQSLSYSKLDTFNVCPLKFKYRYLLQIPARPHHAMSFGRSIHTALQLFHSQEMQGLNPSLDQLLSFYRDNFIEEGYESESQKQERFEAGLKSLTNYFHHYHEVLGKPVMLEQQFKLNLSGISFIGKIDRIETDAAGNYAIVDYKTGASEDQKAVDKDEQLTIYALAAQEALGLVPETLSLYFLEADAGLITTTRTPEKLVKARLKLINQIETLKNSAFPPKPTEFTCTFCEYKRLCPYSKAK